MSWVMAGVAVVGGGIKMYQGYKQKQAGDAAEAAAQANKPEFQITQEARQNLRDAEQMAAQGLAVEQRTSAEQDIQRTTQAAMMGSADRRGGLGMVSTTAATEQRANLGLLQQDVQARRDNMQNLMTVRDTMTGYKNKQFEHQYNEYSSDLDYARGQQGAGIQNQQQGTQDLISGLGTGAQGLVGSTQGEVTDPSAQQRLANPDAENTPQAKKSIYGTDGNIFTGKKREAYNEYLDEMDSSDMVGDMSGALKFKDWKALNESNQTPINPEGSLTYDWRKGGGKRRIKKAMRGNKGSGNGRANFGFLPTNNY
tara:strand:+ start:1121 stop:2053 length:933 start_codon:yes stop_codon:yes gene_type:complete